VKALSHFSLCDMRQQDAPLVWTLDKSWRMTRDSRSVVLTNLICLVWLLEQGRPEDQINPELSGSAALERGITVYVY